MLETVKLKLLKVYKACLKELGDFPSICRPASFVLLSDILEISHDTCPKLSYAELLGFLIPKW